MNGTLKIHQIYFKEDQIGLLEPEYWPFFNDNCTEFFEASVISKLVNELELRSSHKVVDGICFDFVNGEESVDYFGVVSYQLREKIGVMKAKWRGNIANTSRNQFSPAAFKEDLFSCLPDAMSFQRHPAHDPISLADRYHPNFSKYFKEIMKQIGHEWKPVAFENVFYCNFFVAKVYWYKRFVSEMLDPAMAVMKNMPELWNDSKYPKKLPENLAIAWGKEGLTHYPYHSFICERMFSYFAHIHKLDCKHF